MFVPSALEDQHEVKVPEDAKGHGVRKRNRWPKG